MGLQKTLTILIVKIVLSFLLCFLKAVEIAIIQWSLLRQCGHRCEWQRVSEDRTQGVEPHRSRSLRRNSNGCDHSRDGRFQGG